MTCHRKRAIKNEPFSPTKSTCCFSSPDGGGSYPMLSSGADINAMTQSQTADVDSGIPCKCPKLESKDEEGSVTPEMKSKLKKTVLTRRRARGYIDVPINLFDEPKEYPLTQADQEKRDRRKKQNREAAKRCRAKKKEKEQEVAQKKDKTEEDYERLKRELGFILPEFQKLFEHLLLHMDHGTCKLASSVRDVHMQQVFKLQQHLEDMSNYHLKSEKQMPPTDTPTDFPETEFLDSSISSNSSSDKRFMPSTDSNFSDSENLPSWDINNITPDIPQNMDLSLSQFHNDKTVSLFQTPILNIENAQVNYKHDPAAQYCLPDDFLHPNLVVDRGFVAGHKFDSSYKNNNICMSSLLHGGDEIHSISACTESQGFLPTYPCVSPNLVQPVSSTYQPTTARTFDGTNNPNKTSEFVRSLPIMLNTTDLNNNTTRAITPDKPGHTLNSSCTGQSINIRPITKSTPQNMDTVNDQYFTFDYDPQQFESLVRDIASEPISPFYTQAGNTRCK